MTNTYCTTDSATVRRLLQEVRVLQRRGRRKDDFRDGFHEEYFSNILLVQPFRSIILYALGQRDAFTAIHPSQDEFLQLTGGVHSSNCSVGGGTTPTRHGYSTFDSKCDSTFLLNQLRVTCPGRTGRKIVPRNDVCKKTETVVFKLILP